MRISFDLDDTLFISPDRVKAEPKLRFPFCIIYRDRLRAGTIALMKQLKEMHAEIWIYTTSFRSERYIRRLFRCYGISIDAVVNGQRHAREVQGSKTEAMPSKYPSRYRIDLHVDDDSSVAQNGAVYGFNVFIIREQDAAWQEAVINRVKLMQNSHHAYKGDNL